MNHLKFIHNNLSPDSILSNLQNQVDEMRSFLAENRSGLNNATIGWIKFNIATLDLQISSLVKTTYPKQQLSL
ncbi:hypothetical protein ABSA28_00912 [Candidatus Hepatincolaceae symbiont of Richtersius coronifer]